MKKLLLVSLCFLMLFMTQVYAQNRSVTGTVKAKEDGLPLPGVTVKVKGSSVGTQTNASGKFTLSVPSNATLTFSFVGYAPVDMAVPANGVIDVSLEASSHQLSEVLVTTAFGVQKNSGTIGYNATSVNSKDLTQAAPTNFTNGLTAKVAGLVVSTLDNGINPATRFTLRGNRHINGNNFALVILNGTPISPNDVNTINPDDIEDVTVLNGAGAAALYGSEASNGALVITTKKGTASGAPVINYSNTFQLEKLAYFPNLQTQFGSYGGEGPPYQDAITGFVTSPAPFENQSYGPLYDGHNQQLGIPLQDGTIQSYPYSTPSVDPRKAFFNTGHTEQNDISYATGDAENYFRLSANRLDRTGIVPFDTYARTIARISAGHTYGIFHAEFTASYSQSNTSTYGGNYSNDGGADLYGSILNTPSWVPIENYKNVNAPFADASTYYNSYDINPYWTVNNSRVNSSSTNFNGSFSGVLTPAKWVDLTYRLANNFGTAQSQSTQQEVDFTPYAFGKTAVGDPTGGFETEAIIHGTNVPGSVTNSIQYGDGTNTGTGTQAGPQGFARVTQDMIASFHHTFFTDFKTNLRVGTTMWQETLHQMQNSSANLFIKDFYNINYISGIPTTSDLQEKIRQISYFGDLSIGYKDFLNVEGTLRNEHDSRLNDANRSIYYPAVNGTVVLTNAIDAIKNNRTLSYAKLRASYAQVGDVNVNPYTYQPNSFSLTSGFPYGSLTALSLSTTLNNPNLKPELTKEVEFGLDLGFFDNRITGSVTYYNDHTTNQTLSINTSPSIGYTSTLVNVGDVQNQGLEFKLDAQVLTKAKNNVGLTLSGNLAIQNSKVISLTNGLPSVNIGGSQQAVIGYPFPEIVASDLVRDPQGHPVVSATTGYPSANSTLQNLGRTTPKYILGLTQSISYKFITLTLVSEFRTGAVFIDNQLATANLIGTSQFTAQTGRSRFVFPNSVINTGTAANPVYVPNTNVAIKDPAIGFWDGTAFSGASPVTSTVVESAAFWKLREANLAFDLSKFVKGSKFIKRASFAINGRNLVLLRPKTNTFTDPEFSSSSGNGGGTQNTGQLPPTRIFGANLNLTF